MSYPSQPGYPTPQYGQPQPPGQRQNNLWLIGGAIIIILVIIMTVILVLVQNNAGSDSGDGGDGGETEGQTEGEEDPDGGETDHEELSAGAFETETCDQIDMGKFEEATGETVDPESNYHSSSEYESYDNVSCYFYTSESFHSLNINLYDYETADEVLSFIEYDAEYYSAEADYEYEEYTAHGDAGALYTNISDPSYQTTYLHVALGSLETSLSMNYDGTKIETADAKAALEDVLLQVDALFADVQ